MKISAFYPNFFHLNAIVYVALSIMQTMQSSDIQTSLMGIASDKDITHKFYRDAIPRWLKSIAYRLFSVGQLTKIAESRFFKSLNPKDIVYLWPTSSLTLHQKLHNYGYKVITEFINTHQATSKVILDAEYLRLGLVPSHGITADNAAEDTLKSDLVDFIFSCSPNVTNSLLKANVPFEKILETTYGLKESDLFAPDELCHRSKTDEVNAIFVGTIGVRKGPHLLLDYWCKSGVKGNLTLVGDIQPDLLPIIKPYLLRPNIHHISYVKDLKPIYKKADVFMLPSLEEGSPLVTYLALGAGLPCIVSPMGAGGIIEHGVEGFVIAHDNADAWIKAIQEIANNKNIRDNFAKNALLKAPNYFWTKVGQQRAKLLSDRIKNYKA